MHGALTETNTCSVRLFLVPNNAHNNRYWSVENIQDYVKFIVRLNTIFADRSSIGLCINKLPCNIGVVETWAACRVLGLHIDFWLDFRVVTPSLCR